MPGKSFLLKDPESALKVAGEFLQATEGCRQFAFYGAMGVGKTTFIQALCKVLGVETPVTSPTFAIVNEYYGKDGVLVYHFDFYRLTHPKDIFDIGGEEYFDGKGWCFVEWPEKAEPVLPPDICRVKLTETNHGYRLIEIIEKPL